jgi:S1-C subfamily serine protease
MTENQPNIPEVPPQEAPAPELPSSPPPESPPPQPQPEPVYQPEPPPPKRKTRRSYVGLALVAILLVGLFGGGLIGYFLSYNAFNGKINSLQTQINNLPAANATYISYPNSTYILSDNVSLATLYQQVRGSVVVIQDILVQTTVGMFGGHYTTYTQQQGSGFIAEVNNQLVIITNNHVIESTINITVTFADGNSYPATVAGSDAYADLAVLTMTQMPENAQPLTIVASSSLQVGDPVVAVGSPYGLTGTLTTGVVSALGRTITESETTNINIPDVIQTSTAINPGNSGGPLINYLGQVVGITTAGISNSESLGFAIPSDTILREASTLLSSGSYDQHPSIGASGIDMNYQVAQAIGTNVTYGWLVESLSYDNGLQAGNQMVTLSTGDRIIVGGDIIIGINGIRVVTVDDILSYLEQNTLPGQNVDFTIVRDGQTQTVSVNIGKLVTS